jgi:hypothetical protein
MRLMKKTTMIMSLDSQVKCAVRGLIVKGRVRRESRETMSLSAMLAPQLIGFYVKKNGILFEWSQYWDISMDESKERLNENSNSNPNKSQPILSSPNSKSLPMHLATRPLKKRIFRNHSGIVACRVTEYSRAMLRLGVDIGLLE